MTTICILGRQPQLGLAELEALFGAKAVQSLGSEAALLDVEPRSIPQDKLGGAMKVAEVITIFNSTNWPSLMEECLKTSVEYLSKLPEGKLTIGLSVYGLRTTPEQINRSALELKKRVKAIRRPVRIVPNNELALNSAQVWHNKLTDELGVEFIFIADRGRTYFARTTSVQDINSYSARDFGRPKRDARVGMLPPKLAQMMLNLSNPEEGATILDPFCGTGVVLMEAALQGYSLAGSDLSEKMVDYTLANLEWLTNTYHTPLHLTELVTADATNHQWKHAITNVVTETYLGRPLNTLPDPQTLQTIINDCNTIIRMFLVNLYKQLTPGARCCIAVPAWKTRQGFIHLPVVDDLKKIGYNRISFSHANKNDLLYHRPDQVVGRELLVLTR